MTGFVLRHHENQVRIHRDDRADTTQFLACLLFYRNTHMLESSGHNEQRVSLGFPLFIVPHFVLVSGYSQDL